MRLQHAEQRVHAAGRRGDLERAFVFVPGREAESQLKFRDDEINQFEPARELFDEAAQDEQQGFGGFDFVFELDLLGERLRRRDEFERTDGIRGRRRRRSPRCSRAGSDPSSTR